MNDIHHASKKFHSILYVDDTSLLDTLCSFDTEIDRSTNNMEIISSNINAELNDILIWLSLNKLSLNVKKTKFMLFHYRQRKIGHLIPKLEINGYEIERDTDFNMSNNR